MILLLLTSTGCMKYQSESIRTDEIKMVIDVESEGSSERALISVKMEAGRSTYARKITLSGDDRLFVEYGDTRRELEKQGGHFEARVFLEEGDNDVSVVLEREAWPSSTTTLVIPDFTIDTPAFGESFSSETGLHITWTNPHPSKEMKIGFDMDCLEDLELEVKDSGSRTIDSETLDEWGWSSCDGSLVLTRKWKTDNVDPELREGKIKIKVERTRQVEYDG